MALGGSPGVGRGQGSGGTPHLALTVALYAHQRLNPRLLYLALRTLTRFAQVRDTDEGIFLLLCFPLFQFSFVNMLFLLSYPWHHCLFFCSDFHSFFYPDFHSFFISVALTFFFTS